MRGLTELVPQHGPSETVVLPPQQRSSRQSHASCRASQTTQVNVNNENWRIWWSRIPNSQIPSPLPASHSLSFSFSIYPVLSISFSPSDLSRIPAPTMLLQLFERVATIGPNSLVGRQCAGCLHMLKGNYQSAIVCHEIYVSVWMYTVCAFCLRNISRASRNTSMRTTPSTSTSRPATRACISTQRHCKGSKRSKTRCERRELEAAASSVASATQPFHSSTCPRMKNALLGRIRSSVSARLQPTYVPTYLPTHFVFSQGQSGLLARVVPGRWWTLHRSTATGPSLPCTWQQQLDR
eukprot:GHVU01202867.1.p1 GENE.GHVU01202867.1~~GHVU01202867.1.p1  ORF type:complete len:295 (+),score=1.65 GHVU01202867.1:724-1608(+)